MSTRMQRVKAVSRYVLAIFMIVAGGMHFVYEDFYLRIMPRYLPAHRLLVFLSGVAEIVIGVMLLIPRFTHLAAWGAILLLIAVFPANLHVYQNPEVLPAPGWLHLLRLPLQGVFIAWAWWHTRPDAESGSKLLA